MNIGDSFGSPIGQTISLGDLIGNFLTVAIVIAGVIIVFLFIAGGLMIIASASSGDTKGAAGGKQAVTWALIGFIIIFTAYWVIRVFEIISGVDFLTDFGTITGGPPPVPPPGPGPV